MKLKILSWNIWCYGNLSQVAQSLKASNADIICLQEVLPKENKVNIINYLSELGYDHFYADSMKIEVNGEMIFMENATFSKYKILENKTHILSETKHRIAIESKVQINGAMLHIFNTHLTHEHLKESKERDLQMDSLIKLLPKERVLVMGDFNSLPNSKTVQKINKVLKNTDPSFTPTWMVYPNGCNVCEPKGINYRLDYIFASEDIAVLSSKVENFRPSDHLPVSAVIEV